MFLYKVNSTVENTHKCLEELKTSGIVEFKQSF